MTDPDVRALIAENSAMQSELRWLREANAYPAAIRAAARAEERERCAKALEAEAAQWERNWVANVLIEQASAIRALGDE